MPGFVCADDERQSPKRRPRKAGRKTRAPLLSRHTLLVGLAVAALCLSQGERVWAIGERLSSDPVGREAALRAQGAQNGLFINARMAVSPAEDQAARQRYVPEVKNGADVLVASFHASERLVSTHDTFALIRTGEMRFPDGAIATIWGQHGAGAAGVSKSAPNGMGRSVAVPSDRVPPSDLWRRLKKSEEGKPSRDQGWQFVPASFLPLFASSSEASPMREAAQTGLTYGSARFGRPTTTAAVMFDTPDAALDARACSELDRIAADLRTTIYPVELRSYLVQSSGTASSSALDRALNVRAYLVARGVPMDRIRIMPADSPSLPARDRGPYRVDVIYTTS